jgi:hypothetical protein
MENKKLARDLVVRFNDAQSAVLALMEEVKEVAKEDAYDTDLQFSKCFGEGDSPLAWISQYFSEYMEHCKGNRCLYRKSEKVVEAFNACIETAVNQGIDSEEFDEFFVAILLGNYEISEPSLRALCIAIEACMQALFWSFVGGAQSAIATMDAYLQFSKSIDDSYDSCDSCDNSSCGCSPICDFEEAFAD